LAREWQIDFRPRLEELLGRDPTPHRTRRIRRRPDKTFQIGCGGWLAGFTVAGDAVLVTGLEPGYPPRLLDQAEHQAIPDHAAQVAFSAHWKVDSREQKNLMKAPFD
jgi:hypothetical protein